MKLKNKQIYQEENKSKDNNKSQRFKRQNQKFKVHIVNK